MNRVLALVLIAGGLSWPAAPASAQSAQSYDGACTDNAGVTVVVDFQDLGGGVNVRCAPDDVTSGLDALDKADISWEGTLRFPGFVCRIAGQPGADDDPCVNTPPDTAFWTYWVAPRGGTWCYSSFGAGSRTPPAGTVEGWSFAKNRAGSALPTPGYDPPPPPEGLVATALNPSDCPAAGGTTPTTSSAATTTPAAPATTAAPSAPATTPTAPPATSATTTAATGTTRTTPGASTGSPGATTTTAAVAPSEGGASSTTTSVEPTSTTSTRSGPGTTTRSLGAVDLSNGGKRNGGVSAFTVLVVAVMLALVGTGAVFARRRRATPS